MISRIGGKHGRCRLLSVLELPTSDKSKKTISSRAKLAFASNKCSVRKMSSGQNDEAGPSAESVTNKLKHEKSPYLLQHQHNPVQWYAWGEEAFELAAQRKKPIFLSVGYSTCHWCHVMERESFENPEVAKVMNKHFVNIKVDREERPDVDRLYMTFVQAVSGSGGWPMSVWMTPDLKPFYGGTYYPPDDRMYGRPGFKSLLLTIAEQWDEDNAKFVTSAEKILQVLKRTATLPVYEKPMIVDEITEKCVQQLGRSFEPAFGGFSDHPKFPQPVNLNFLIHYRKANPGNANALRMVERTLKCMAAGGIYDHVGKGFCRYSTDKKWHVPHFEKMLYDNAQLCVTYAETYLLTKDDAYARVAKEILEYISRDMSHEEGGFYSAEDADSYEEGSTEKKAEGAFYVWTKDEIVSILGSNAINDKVKIREVFEWRYGIRDAGNVDPRQDPHGELTMKNVLYIGHSVEETAKHFSILPDEVKRACAQAKSMLFDYRNKNRARPGLDTKFITSWNSMMISAYARGGIAISTPHYVERAEQGMKFLNTYSVTPTDDLIRTSYRDGDTNSSPVTNLNNVIMGCVDDFANFVAANLDLFDATWKLKYLRQAIQFQKLQDDLFWDDENGGYFNSRVNSECIVRFKDDDDGAEPSSNSTSVLNLIRLDAITDYHEYEGKIDKLFKQFGDRLTKVPMSLPMMTAAFQAYSKGASVVLALRNGSQESETLKQIRSRLLPMGSTVVGVNISAPETNVSEWISILPYFAEKLDHFNSLKTDEIVYLKQGKKFTHSYNKSDFEVLINAL